MSYLESWAEEAEDTLYTLSALIPVFLATPSTHDDKCVVSLGIEPISTL